jgi:hypothetical protein
LDTQSNHRAAKTRFGAAENGFWLRFAVQCIYNGSKVDLSGFGCRFQRLKSCWQRRFSVADSGIVVVTNFASESATNRTTMLDNRRHKMTTENNRISNAVSESVNATKSEPVTPAQKTYSRSPFKEPTCMVRVPMSLIPALRKSMERRRAEIAKGDPDAWN